MKPTVLPRALIIGNALTMLAIAAPASAEGIRAGTLIENTASATFRTNGIERTISSNSVQIRVDELLNVAIASQDGAPVTSSGRSVLTFRIANTGNGSEAFTLTADPALAGNAFNPAVVTLAIDSNGNGIYDDPDTIIANGGVTDAITPDGSVTVFVVLDDGGAPDNQTARVQLTAAAVTGTGTPGTTFAGQGDGGGDAVAGTSGANDDATGAIVTSAAAVALQKSATIVDPFGGTQPVPGAVVSFEIIARVSGSGAVNGLNITDVIPAGTTYSPNSLRYNGTALTDAVDGDAGRASASGVAVAVGTAVGGTSPTITFDVIIN